MLAVLQLDEFQNMKYLCLKHFDSLAHIHCRNNISFPKLERLWSGTVLGIEFPQLRKMHINSLPEFQNFWRTANNSIADSNPLFDEKVSCTNLEELSIYSADNITALCSHQFQIAYLSKLLKSEVENCVTLRNFDVSIGGQRSSESPETKDRKLRVNGRSDHRRGTRRRRNHD